MWIPSIQKQYKKTIKEFDFAIKIITELDFQT